MRCRLPTHWGRPACSRPPVWSRWSSTCTRTAACRWPRSPTCCGPGSTCTSRRGGLQHLLHHAARDARPACEALCEQVGNAPEVTPDETGWRVGTVGHWLWAFATPTTTVYAICAGRGFDDAQTVNAPNGDSPPCSGKTDPRTRAQLGFLLRQGNSAATAAFHVRCNVHRKESRRSSGSAFQPTPCPCLLTNHPVNKDLMFYCGRSGGAEDKRMRRQFTCALASQSAGPRDRPTPSKTRCSSGPADSRAAAARSSRAPRGSRPGSRRRPPCRG